MRFMMAARLAAGLATGHLYAGEALAEMVAVQVVTCERVTGEAGYCAVLREGAEPLVLGPFPSEDAAVEAAKEATE